MPVAVKAVVTFVNYNDEVLDTQYFDYGDMPQYTGNTPTRPDSGSTHYSYSGWDPVLKPVVENATYKAQFSENTVSYRIDFLNYDGTLLKSVLTEANQAPEYDGDMPKREAVTIGESDDTTTYSFAFDGWATSSDGPKLDSLPVATGPAQYYAVYTSASKSVTVENSSTKETVEKPDGSVITTETETTTTTIEDTTTNTTTEIEQEAETIETISPNNVEGTDDTRVEDKATTEVTVTTTDDDHTTVVITSETTSVIEEETYDKEGDGAAETITYEAVTTTIEESEKKTLVDGVLKENPIWPSSSIPTTKQGSSPKTPSPVMAMPSRSGTRRPMVRAPRTRTSSP